MTAVERTNTNAAFRAFYSFGNVTMSDSGTYRCIVTNPIGSDNATVTVVVESMYSIMPLYLWYNSISLK